MNEKFHNSQTSVKVTANNTANSKKVDDDVIQQIVTSASIFQFMAH